MNRLHGLFGVRKKTHYPSSRQRLWNDVLHKDCERLHLLCDEKKRGSWPRKSVPGWLKFQDRESRTTSLSRLNGTYLWMHHDTWNCEIICELFLLSPSDAGWKSPFNTVYNGLPKQRQDSWMHTVSFSLCDQRSVEALIKQTRLNNAVQFLFPRYQQILHRNLVYLATIADSNQNMQSLLPAVSVSRGVSGFSITLKLSDNLSITFSHMF